MDKQFEKWIRWLKIIENDMGDIVLTKYIFWEIQTILKNNSQLHNQPFFNQYLGRTYISHVLMGIRRQIKVDNSSITLKRLLQEISQNPQKITRGYFVGLFQEPDLVGADAQFDKYAGKGQDHIDPVLVCNDITMLEHMSHACEKYADKKIAHRDKSKPNNLTFEQIDDCVESIEKLYCKYYFLFHASSLPTVLPSNLPDWKVVFRVPWLSPSEQ